MGMIVSDRDSNGDFSIGEWLFIPILAGTKIPRLVPANTHGKVFSPVPVREFILVKNHAGNLSPLEIQYLKLNLN
jgi:hypothetical protein